MVEDLGEYDFLSPQESRGFKEGSRGYITGAQGKQGLAAASRGVMMDLPCPSKTTYKEASIIVYHTAKGQVWTNKRKLQKNLMMQTEVSWLHST